MASNNISSKLQSLAARSFKKIIATRKGGPSMAKSSSRLHGKLMQEEAFLQKLRQCRFDFCNPSVPPRGEEEKEVVVIELAEYILMTDRSLLSAYAYREIISMFADNVFRNIDGPLRTEAMWNRLLLVHEFFLAFLELPEFDPASAKKYIDEAFLARLLELFRSESPAERNILKTTLHRIYYRIVPRREFLRREMSNYLARFISEETSELGVSQLLEIYGSIACGFATPMKPEHKQFLLKTLLPLHRTHPLAPYHPQLTFCIVQFVEKDPSLTELVVKTLIRSWPNESTQKELMFIAELEEILDVAEVDQYLKVQEPLSYHLASCLFSPDDLVIQRVLFLWDNEYFVGLVDVSHKPIMKIMFPALYRLGMKHNNQTIVALAYNVLKIFMAMDPKFFNDLSNTYSSVGKKTSSDE